MQFFTFTSTIILQFYSTFCSPASDNDRLVGAAAVAPGQNYIKGYECGNTYFTDYEVKEYLSICLQPGNPYAPYVYHGPLYSDAQNSEYILWPIKRGKRTYPNTKYSSSPFYIVWKRRENDVIDVIARTSDNHFTKCIKIDNSREERSGIIFENTNGYLCGHEFISDQDIQQVVGQARTGTGGNIGYPALYVGNLYKEASGYMIWPILIRKNNFSDKRNPGPYFIVINKEAELIDVVVRGTGKNFLRCERSRKLPNVPVSDPFNNFIAPSLKSGFQCGKLFFGDDTLHQAASVARGVGYVKNFGYPEIYQGDPFNEPCLLWPIMRNRRLYKKGIPGSYRVVLTFEFKVITAVIFENGRMKVCDRITIQEEINHDTSDYICGNDYLDRQLLIRSVERGCQQLSSISRILFPARYEGPRFEKDGPYYTYPVFPKKDFKTRPGMHRVVMNQGCELVGAITIIIKTSKVFMKCHRIEDGQVLEQSYYNPNEPIFEHRLK